MRAELELEEGFIAFRPRWDMDVEPNSLLGINKATLEKEGESPVTASGTGGETGAGTSGGTSGGTGGETGSGTGGGTGGETGEGGDDVALWQWAGTWEDVLQDIARMGAGTARHLGAFDLTWDGLGSLRRIGLEEDTGIADRPNAIPPPGEIASWLFDEDTGCPVPYIQEHFGAALVLCALLGLEMTPTVFSKGGGSRLDQAAAADAGIDWDRLLAGRPAFQQGLVFPAEEQGWHPYYYDPDAFPGAVTRPWNAPTDDQVCYQQYAITVYWEGMEGEGADYMAEAARRKALAVAAFGLAVGKVLRFYDEVFRDQGLSLTDIVPYLECGNEMEALGAEEYGRFMALLAGPIYTCLPKLRFRAAELASWVQDDALGPQENGWTAKLDWLHTALAVGLKNECIRWQQVEDDMLDWGTWGEAESHLWFAVCVGADFFWPPLLATGRPEDRLDITDPAQLVHEVGFHWYHGRDTSDVEGDDSGFYASEVRLIQDIQQLQNELIQPLARCGYTLTWSCAEGGFPGVTQEDPGSDGSINEPYNPHANDLFQAGMLIRRMLVLLAMGARRAGWHTFMSRVVADDQKGKWTQFTGHGVRSDIGDPENQHYQCRGAFRRPSWFALNRLAWLLEMTETIEVVTADDASQLIVLKLRSRTGFYVPDTPIPRIAAEQRFDTAYIAWVDQTGTSAVEIDLPRRRGSSYTFLSLVPLVVPQPRPDPKAPGCLATDFLGYALERSVDWLWDGWGWFHTDVDDTDDQAIRLLLQPLNGAPSDDQRPAPVCVL